MSDWADTVMMDNSIHQQEPDNQNIDKYIDSLRSDYQIMKMDADSNYFEFSEDSIDKIIKAHMRKEQKWINVIFYRQIRSESKELHPTFKLMG